MQNSKIVQKVVLRCGKGACCPEVHFHEDGSADIVDNDDGRSDKVHLNAGQLAALTQTLNTRSGE